MEYAVPWGLEYCTTKKYQINLNAFSLKTMAQIPVLQWIILIQFY